ncbi:hypothetical protein HOY80DRAFT_1000953 [Tuber brumale]|nr:hypothetical protein HOY80DRAFT_1000953 [Tuber brumale]
MVSIKSLAVILFAAAVTAIPVAGGEGHGDIVKDNSKSCTGQDQEMFCCNDHTKSTGHASHVALVDKIPLKCNNVNGNFQSVQGVSGQSQCSGKAVCCTGKEASQNGFLNFATGCFALAAN